MGTRLLLHCFAALLSCALCHAGFAGKEFATAFMQNCDKQDPHARFQIQISALNSDTKVKVSVPALGFVQQKTLKAGEGASIQLPNNVEISGSQRSKKTVLIKACQDVTVTSLSSKLYSADTSVIYPVEKWGTEYFVFTPNGKSGLYEFSITNYNQSNKVQIFPEKKLKFQGTYYKDEPINVVLQPHETLQIQSENDLSGTRVLSALPVAVSSGHTCVGKFTKCNHAYEQLIPVQNWGTSFLVAPLQFQKKYDSLYIQASQETEVVVKLKGKDKKINLKVGKPEEIKIKEKDSGALISANHGIQVLYLFNGVKINKNTAYNPFLMAVLPTKGLCSTYTLNGLAGFDNKAIILVHNDDKAGLTFDNAPLPSNVKFIKINGTEFSWAEVPFKGAGQHSASHPTTSFGVYSVGVSDKNGYGAPALCGKLAPFSCSSMKCGEDQKCEMKEGVPVCVNKRPSASCSLKRTHHYKTFDGRHFDFMGTCTYILAQACGLEGTHLKDYSVRVRNGRRKSIRKKWVTELVDVEVYGYNLTMRENMEGILVNGVLKTIPLNLKNGVVMVYQDGIDYILKTKFGLVVTYNRVCHVTVTVPGKYHEKTCGLCGDFNGKKDDDFRLPNGKIAKKLKTFGMAWKVAIPKQECDDGCTENKCPKCQPKHKAIFQKPNYCGILTDPKGPFASCHAMLNPTPYFEDCIFDICLAKGDRQVLCDSAASYTLDCHTAGGNVAKWRTKSFCAMSCPRNSHYVVCTATCANACPGPADISQCPRVCTEGCECDPGLLFNGKSCIRQEQCGCYDDERSYKPGEVVYDDDCKRKCTCDAKKGLSCQAYSCPSGTKCLVRKGVMGCFNTDPCKDIKCRPQEKCKKGKGEAVCVPKFFKKCRAWGDPHYSSFDGGKFNFQGTCTYTMSKTCGDIGDLEPFSVEEKNENRGKKTVSFVREVYVKVYGQTFAIIKNDYGRVLVNNEVQNLPLELDDGLVTVTQKGRRAVLQTDFGLRVIYNWNSKLVIELPSSYYDSVCGLCGNFNGDPKDDKRDPAGALVSNVIDWGKSWRVPDPEDPNCFDACPVCPDCDKTLLNRYKNEDSCGGLKSKFFQECNKKVDPQPFINDCAYDMCFTEGAKSILCEAVDSYVELCLQEDVNVKDWRKEFDCPMSCPPNSHYEECASACPVTCPLTDEEHPVCAAVCTEDCVCDKGYILSAGKCVPEKECGCSYQGRYYEPGQSFWADEDCIERCVCNTELQMVVCQEDGCKRSERCLVEDGVRACRPVSYSTCKARGDPHYVTFDGRRFDFQGTCIYQLAALCSEDPTLTAFEVTVQNDQRGKRPVSTTKTVWVKVYGVTITISRDHHYKMQMNGQFTSMPFEHDGGNLKVFRSGWTAVVKTAFGLQVTFDWRSTVTVTLPNTYESAVCGLCGNYNGDPLDDTMLPDGTSPKNMAEFGDSWRVGVVPGCTPGCAGPECDDCAGSKLDPFRKQPDCAILTDKAGPFRECHTKVDPDPYLEDCAFDACHFEGQPMCDALAAYVADCQHEGVVIQTWRNATLCPPPCPKNSHYELCASGCPASCASSISRCHLPCREGCRCNEGHLLSGDTCVPLADCGCTYEGHYYKKWEVFYPKDQCLEECKCGENGAIECQPFKCGPGEKCAVVDGVGGCHPLTVGTCVASGDPHYVGFDGKHFDFQGKCVYALAKVCDKYKNELVPFEVRERNGQYGKTKWTTTKEVTVLVYGYVITMKRGSISSVIVDGTEQLLPLSLGKGQITVEEGDGKIILSTDFQLRVMYDVMYRVEVVVPSTYKGKMCGLCGNYNGNKEDDFKLTNGENVTDAFAFGKDWAVNISGEECKDELLIN